MDKIIVIIIAVIVLLGAGFWTWQSGILNKIPPISVKPVPLPEGIILFYGQGCPNCKIVDDFIAQNNIDSKVKYVRLQVFTEGAHTFTDLEKTNQTIYLEAAQKCGQSPKDISVPFLYDGTSKCYSGYPDIINLFKSVAGIK